MQRAQNATMLSFVIMLCFVCMLILLGLGIYFGAITV